VARVGTKALALLAALALGLAGCGDEDDGRGDVRRVRLALDFTPNAAHSGIYAAVEQGHDEDHRVDLRIRPPGASADSLKLLAGRRADVAVADIHDLGLARERGAEVVGIGALVQRPLAAVIAREGVARPRDLEGRRVGVAGLASDDAVLRSVVEDDGGDFGSVRRVTIGFSAVPSLVSRKVDAATAFWNAEGVALRRRGVRTREFRVDDYGAPRYPELVIVARRDTLERDRERLRDALAALADGTRTALEDPGPALEAIARASQAEADDVRAQFDAIRPALTPPLRLDPKALREWAAFDERFGILERRPDVNTTFDFDLAP
jgi:putative hydroxymethylpyrimidine transport system substrate-binding protein